MCGRHHHGIVFAPSITIGVAPTIADVAVAVAVVPSSRVAAMPFMPLSPSLLPLQEVPSCAQIHLKLVTSTVRVRLRVRVRFMVGVMVRVRVRLRVTTIVTH